MQGIGETTGKKTKQKGIYESDFLVFLDRLDYKGQASQDGNYLFIEQRKTKCDGKHCTCKECRPGMYIECTTKTSLF